MGLAFKLVLALIDTPQNKFRGFFSYGCVYNHYVSAKRVCPTPKHFVRLSVGGISTKALQVLCFWHNVKDFTHSTFRLCNFISLLSIFAELASYKQYSTKSLCYAQSLYPLFEKRGITDFLYNKKSPPQADGVFIGIP